MLIDDGLPVFFRQERLGYRRTTVSNSQVPVDAGRPGHAGRTVCFAPPASTRCPQFVNILRGDMSAVGPRPLTADDVARLGWSGAEFDFRWTCRPGLTGLAQLLGARADGEALLLDRVHANGSSLWLDCQLIRWSFAVNAFGKVRIRRWLSPVVRLE